jgi:hypothetical protein
MRLDVTLSAGVDQLGSLISNITFAKQLEAETRERSSLRQLNQARTPRADADHAPLEQCSSNGQAV